MSYLKKLIIDWWNRRKAKKEYNTRLDSRTGWKL